METCISVIFKIVDRFRKRPLLASEVSIYKNEQRIRPLYKDGGYFIYTDLDPGESAFKIYSPTFQTETILLDVPTQDKNYVMKHLLLNPTESYPFGADVTTISGRIMNKKSPLVGAHFYLIPGNGAEVLKVAEDEGAAGKNRLRLFAAVPEMQLSFPGKYLIKDKDEGRREVCLIIQGSDKDGIFSLEKEMRFGHARATPLVEAIECKSADDGSFFAALPHLNSKSGTVDLLVEIAAGKNIKKTLELGSNQRNNLGDIVL